MNRRHFFKLVISAAAAARVPIKLPEKVAPHSDPAIWSEVLKHLPEGEQVAAEITFSEQFLFLISSFELTYAGPISRSGEKEKFQVRTELRSVDLPLHGVALFEITNDEIRKITERYYSHREAAFTWSEQGEALIEGVKPEYLVMDVIQMPIYEITTLADNGRKFYQSSMPQETQKRLEEFAVGSKKT